MQHHKSDQVKIKTQKNKRTPKKISETYLHNSGLYYLERFAASKKHFIKVMGRKVKRSCMHHTNQNYEDCMSIVRTVADKFEKSGLLNDGLLKEGLVRSLRRKGTSKRGILNKLQQKGLDQTTICTTVEKHDEEHHECSQEAEKMAALKLAKKKKMGPYFVGEDENIKKSLGTLARAGFSYDIARMVLEMEQKEAEDLFYEKTSFF
ncbi:MAG: RecX family transcriptional regulator [Alphaproteobacteria bacterium]|nr:RecX family transcriptional regulator [Alphaproteobacteria bacterium]